MASRSRPCAPGGTRRQAEAVDLLDSNFWSQARPMPCYTVKKIAAGVYLPIGLASHPPGSSCVLQIDIWAAAPGFPRRAAHDSAVVVKILDRFGQPRNLWYVMGPTPYPTLVNNRYRLFE